MGSLASDNVDPVSSGIYVDSFMPPGKSMQKLTVEIRPKNWKDVSKFYRGKNLNYSTYAHVIATTLTEDTAFPSAAADAVITDVEANKFNTEIRFDTE